MPECRYPETPLVSRQSKFHARHADAERTHLLSRPRVRSSPAEGSRLSSCSSPVKVKDGRDELYVHLVKGGWRLRDIDEFHPHSSSCWLRGSTVAIGVLTQKCGGKAVTSDLLNNRTVIGVSAHVRRGLRRCVR